ncbi:extracellular solute-binding protein [Kytococcus sedentarius]|uniref:sugar ABC transporter substrate-binding protein n=1 Tax=Kytococcus sedentarius TaxID=1276 RepID=UPI0035BBD75C
MKRTTLSLAATVSIAALTLSACGGDSDSADDTTSGGGASSQESGESGESGDEASGESGEGEESPSGESDASGESGDEESEPAAGESSAPTAAPKRDENADLVIWADDLRTKALNEVKTSFEEEQGITVAVQTVANEQLRQQYKDATGAGEGPDIIVAPHDWAGEFVQDGVIAPVQLSEETLNSFSPEAAEATKYDGQTYGTPYAVEGLGLIRNTELAPEAPKTMEELVETGQSLVKDGKAKNVMSLQVGKQGDAYHAYPFLAAYGGSLFAKEDGGGYSSELTVGSDDMVKGAEKWAWLAEQKALNTNIDSSNALSLFAEGDAPYVISGPWALEQAEEAGISYEVSAIPPFEDGGQPVSPLGVQMFYVSAKAENGVIAQEFVSNFAATDEVQLAMFEAGQRPPALTSAYEKAAESDETVAAWKDAAEGGDPMPNIPAMNAVWAPLGQATADIVGGKAPAERLKAAAEEIKQAL